MKYVFTGWRLIVLAPLFVLLFISIVVALNYDDSCPNPLNKNVIIKSINFYRGTWGNHMVMTLDSGEVLDMEKGGNYPIFLNKPATLIVRRVFARPTDDIVIDIKYHN